MKRTLAGRAAETYVLASTEKVGAVSAYRVLRLGEVRGIVTDAEPDNPWLDRLRHGGSEIILSRPRPYGVGHGRFRP